MGGCRASGRNLRAAVESHQGGQKTGETPHGHFPYVPGKPHLLPGNRPAPQLEVDQPYAPQSLEKAYL